MFVSAMFARTKAFGKRRSQQWSEVLEMGNKIHTAWKNALPKERFNMERALTSPLPGDDKTISFDEVSEIVTNPLQTLLPQTVYNLTPLLFKTP